MSRDIDALIAGAIVAIAVVVAKMSMALLADSATAVVSPK